MKGVVVDSSVAIKTQCVMISTIKRLVNAISKTPMASFVKWIDANS